MNLNDLKREHNELLQHGQTLFRQVEEAYAKLTQLQQRIRDIEGDQYDDIPVMFGSGFHIYEEDEHRLIDEG